MLKVTVYRTNENKYMTYATLEDRIEFEAERQWQERYTARLEMNVINAKLWIASLPKYESKTFDQYVAEFLAK